MAEDVNGKCRACDQRGASRFSFNNAAIWAWDTREWNKENIREREREKGKKVVSQQANIKGNGLIDIKVKDLVVPQTKKLLFQGSKSQGVLKLDPKVRQLGTRG